MLYRSYALFAAVAILLALVACHHEPSGAPAMSPALYQQVAAAFYTGVAEMEIRNDSDAARRLEEAARLAPEEPAIWADLALVHLREREVDRASAALKKARELAPRNSQVELIAGLMERDQKGHAEALADFRRAAEIGPTNAAAHYALVEELSEDLAPVDGAAAGQPGGPAVHPDPAAREALDTEIERHLDQILALQPRNLLAVLELAKLAAREGESYRLQQFLTWLQADSKSWPPEARQQFEKVKRLTREGKEPVIELVILRNLLLGTYPLGRDWMALRAGQALEEFLRLPSPRSTPSPPDMALHFTIHPIGNSCGWVRALPLSPTKRFPGGPESPPLLVRASGSRIVLGTTPETSLPFPAGPLGRTPPPEGVLALDWNSDLKPDLAFVGEGGLRLFQQTSLRQWKEVTRGIPPPTAWGSYTGAWAADLDLDGDLDIVLGTRSGPPAALRNNRDGSWTPIHPFPGVSGLRAFAWLDLDGDGVDDAALVDGQGRLALFQNERSGSLDPSNSAEERMAHFTRLPLPNTLGPVTALSVADVTHRGNLDLVALLEEGSVQSISRLAGGEGWKIQEIARWPGAGGGKTGRIFWADLDNNGALDLVLSGSAGTKVWLADGQGKLLPLAIPVGVQVFSAADQDGDGLLDLVGAARDGTPVVLLNRGGSQHYHWQVIRTRGQEIQYGDERINSFGIGGEVELRAGLLAQKQPIDGPSLHFGLGEYQKANVVRTLWPNGSSIADFDLQADHAVQVVQRLVNSCPWLFAYNGQSMKFVTDLLWRSPLGLKINAQDTAGAVQTRDWVKVQGSELQPDQGFYDLSITAELWETHFFDYVSLLAVDHPVGTEVYVDERFSIPPPPLCLHLMSSPVPAAHAWDEQGHDVTDLVRSRDGRYLDTFPLGQYQGIAQDHFVEVELPSQVSSPGFASLRPSSTILQSAASTPDSPAALSTQPPKASSQSSISYPASNTRNPKSEALWLVASGWVYPTNSSINVAISQGRHQQPQDLSLEIPGKNGKWVTVRRHLGFPAGKTKTILIDLNGVFSPETSGPRRLRLRTNMEIYWDFLAIAKSLPTANSMLAQSLDPARADLHYRGFSVTHTPGRRFPELPEYTLEGTAPRWLDLAGYYTRYGDVRELVQKVDDRYVIMNAGDEMALRFPVPAPPPPGWTRDFVFISDGWVKDGDFNTAFSKTVLPLPSHGQISYNSPPGRLQDDPVYRRYPQDWQQYHTRSVTSDPFRSALWPLPFTLQQAGP